MSDLSGPQTDPGAEASDWERAMALAEDLTMSKHIGERQAKVYAALQVGVPRDEICDRLDMSESNSYSTQYDAEYNAQHAQLLADALDDHPVLNPGRAVSDCAMDEFNPARDWFDTDVRHEGDGRVGEQFQGPHGEFVTVRQTLAEDESGIAGYLLTQLFLDTGEVEQRGVAAGRLDELVANGTLQPATATVERVREE